MPAGGHPETLCQTTASKWATVDNILSVGTDLKELGRGSDVDMFEILPRD